MERGTQSRWREMLLAVYWITLIVATHWPKLSGLPEIPGKDKTMHLVAYGLLTGLMLNVGGRRLRRYGSLPLAAGAIVVAGFYGALDEVTQPLTGRTCSLGDWLANIVGAMIVSGVYLAVTWLRSARGPTIAASSSDASPIR